MATGKNSHLDDMIDIIVNNEKYKKRLIFTNVKKQKNTGVYDSILNEIKERYAGRNPESNFFQFNVQQMRTKFKMVRFHMQKTIYDYPYSNRY